MRSGRGQFAMRMHTAAHARIAYDYVKADTEGVVMLDGWGAKQDSFHAREQCAACDGWFVVGLCLFCAIVNS